MRIAVVLCLTGILGRATAAEITFEGAFSIPNVGRATTVHAGDLDNNGKLDLIVSNGTSTITTLFQDSMDRFAWTAVPVRVGSQVFFTRSGDFDKDGIDDLVVADTATTAYFVKSNGDKTFGRPLALTQARGSRWIAMGDWDNDGSLDLAASNLNTSTLTTFLGTGAGGFTLTQTLTSGREHTLEALDYDGDGTVDLALGVGLPGIRIHKGTGDGKFVYQKNVSNLGCVEYIAVGDLNNDGKGDIAPTCIDDATAYVGVSQGNAIYTRTLSAPFGTGTESSALADIDGDGNQDLALVSQGTGILRVYPGKGDGTFELPLEFASTGAQPVFLISEDLDRDGRNDVISADSGSGTLTIFHGMEGDRILRSANGVSGVPGAAKSFAVDDFDRNGAPDLFFASLTLPKVAVYLNARDTSPTKPSFTIDVPQKLTSMEVIDVDGDGVSDLVGINLVEDLVIIVPLDAAGTPRPATTFRAGQSPPEIKTGPQEIAVGKIDAGDSIDLVIPSAGLNALSVFLATGPGTYGEPLTIPTVEKPKRVTVADVDGDGKSDVIVLTTKIVVIHWGAGDGSFSAPVTLADDVLKSFGDAAVADLGGDSIPEIVLTEARSKSVLVLQGQGARAFAPAFPVGVVTSPTSVLLTDVDDDGFVDITTSSTASQAVTIVWNLGTAGFSTEPVSYRSGVPTTLHRFVDMNVDGVKDMVSMGSTGGSIRLGRLGTEPPPGTFRRGDADRNRTVAINDAVAILNSLFGDAGTLACEDAGDVDDDGVVNLTDAIRILRWLFLDDEAPVAPGPFDCGADPTVDAFAQCAYGC